MLQQLFDAIPGVSLKVGVTKKKRPYARAATNIGGFNVGKNLDLGNKNHLIAGAAVALLFANAVKDQKKKPSKKKKAPEAVPAGGVQKLLPF